MFPGRTPSARDVVDGVVQRAFVVEAGILVALLVGFRAYTVALNDVLDPYFLDSDLSLSLVHGVLVLAAMGVLAAPYRSWRGEALSAPGSDSTTGRLVCGAVAVAAVLATLPFSLLALQTGVGVGHVVATVSDLPGLFLDRTLVRVGLFVSGMVLLYHGVVQGALRRVFDRDRSLAVVVTTLLAGYLVAPEVPSYGAFANGPWLTFWGARAAVAGLFVLALGVAVSAEERSVDGRVRTLATLPVLAVLALAAVVLATAAGSLGGAFLVATRTAVVGVAAATYERTASLVAPTLVYATVAVVSTVLHAAAMTAVLGA
jgi:hypothetical protein